LQLPAVPVPVFYTPVQAIAPVAPVKRGDTEGNGGAEKLRAAPPPGAGTLLDINA
jgi:hypothetical protein